MNPKQIQHLARQGRRIKQLLLTNGSVLKAEEQITLSLTRVGLFSQVVHVQALGSDQVVVMTMDPKAILAAVLDSGAHP